jgi:hypothetical protein
MKCESEKKQIPRKIVQKYQKASDIYRVGSRFDRTCFQQATVRSRELVNESVWKLRDKRVGIYSIVPANNKNT